MARITKGNLYTSGAKKFYYLRFKTNGKDCRMRLLGTDGKPITRRDAAEEAAEEILQIVTKKNKADQYIGLQAKIQSAENAAMEATADLINSKATFINGWRLFMTCSKRPKSCKRFSIDAIPRHSTPGNYEGYYRQFSAWVKVKHKDCCRLSEITPEIAMEYATHLEKLNISTGTFNKVIQFFKMFYSVLVKGKHLSCMNPFSEIEHKDNYENSRSPLTMEQIARLVRSADGELKILIALGYFTGLRFGDCCTLLWREVDLLRRQIERMPRKTENTCKDKAAALVKIGINPILQQLLSGIPPESRKGYVLPKFGAEYDRGADANLNGIVIAHFQKNGIRTTREGTGIKILTDPKTGEPVIDKKTGKPKRTGRRAVVEVGFHSLRYSYISHHAEAGTPQAVIQKNAGHANPAMTEHYMRISDARALEYAAALQLPLASDDITIDAEVIQDTAQGNRLLRIKSALDTAALGILDEVEKILNLR